MPTQTLNTNVFNEALERIKTIYQKGHRVIVSFSGGKDSTVCLELAILAAEATGRLPVEVMMRDDEIMLPGTFEYCERVAERADVSFNWIIANQPVINIFNREKPYIWVFDPLLSPEEWVRQPPDKEYVMRIPEKHIQGIVIPARFPPSTGKQLFALIGLRADESRTRRMAVHSSKGYLAKPNEYGTRGMRPIYDWRDGDIWKAILDNGWDYNSAYNVMFRLGMKRKSLRIAPPTQVVEEIERLRIAMKAWPKWFDKVCKRCPGVRSITLFGRRVVEPRRNYGESWQDTYMRECINEAPAWIAERAEKVMKISISSHTHHATTSFPNINPCIRCGRINSWKLMTKAMYSGDPFCNKQSFLKPIDPEFFRKGAGTWGGGKATW